MATKSFLPTKDAALLAWSSNFSTLISAGATSYGLTTAQATAYATLHGAYSTAYAAVDPGVRSKAAVATKNTARAALKTSARLLAKLVEGTASVTNAQKISLGLNVRATPTPIPPPADAPNLDVTSVSGRTLKIKLHDGTGSRRGKPPGVNGATVLSYVGATPPVGVGSWKFEGNTSRTIVDVVFDNSIAPGATVWLTAFWFNERKQSGPACTPVGVTFGAAVVSAMAA